MAKVEVGLLLSSWEAQRGNNRKGNGRDWILHWFLSKGAFNRRVAIQWSLLLVSKASTFFCPCIERFVSFLEISDELSSCTYTEFVNRLVQCKSQYGIFYPFDHSKMCWSRCLEGYCTRIDASTWHAGMHRTCLYAHNLQIRYLSRQSELSR